MHLVSNKKGTVSKVSHEDEINSMESVRLLAIEPKVGEPIVETVNIRTDSGYVLLENIDPEVLQRDYERIIELQETMFEVEEDAVAVEAIESTEESVVATKSRRRRRIQATEEEINSNPASEQPLDQEQLQSEEQRQQSHFGQEQVRGQDESVGRAMDNSFESPQVKELIKKMSRVGLRVSAILTGYCAIIYTAALLIPLIYSA